MLRMIRRTALIALGLSLIACDTKLSAPKNQTHQAQASQESQAEPVLVNNQDSSTESQGEELQPEILVREVVAGSEKGGCYSLDSCLDVTQNDYTVISQGYSTWAEGIHISSQVEWQLSLTTQQESGFVQGINFDIDTQWEERIELDYDPSAKIDPYEFAKRIERTCQSGECKTKVF